jgi:antitoxin component of RelBE/YafQ-DinJ toxin-antitoxin module
MSTLKESNINIRINKELKDSYIKFCNKKGYDISKRIRIFIQEELNGENNTNK